MAKLGERHLARACWQGNGAEAWRVPVSMRSDSAQTGVGFRPCGREVAYAAQDPITPSPAIPQPPGIPDAPGGPGPERPVPDPGPELPPGPAVPGPDIPPLNPPAPADLPPPVA